MNSQKLAKFLSIILGPFWLPIFLLLFLFKSGLTSDQLTLLFPIMSVFQVLIPLGYLFLAVKLGWVSAWDLPIRKQRRAFIVVTFISNLITLLLVLKFGNKLAGDLNIIFLALISVIFGITIFWKISLHAALNTFGTLLINFLYSWQFPWLYLLIPAVYWARFTLKRHTHTQLLAGILVSGTIFLGGLKIFGYL